MDDAHLVLLVKMLRNVNTPYPLIYTGVFLGVTGVNFLENIVYISNE